MRHDFAEPAQAAVALVERSITRLAVASLELARSRAWNDLLDTVDRLAAMLGTDVGAAAEPVPAEVDPAQIARFVAGWVESLVLPEYLERSEGGRSHYRVRLPEEARSDGLGDLADFLDSLGLRLDLSVDGDTAQAMGELFLECIIAPSFDPEALALLGAKRNLRLLAAVDHVGSGGGAPPRGLDFRSVRGGMLIQDTDVVGRDISGWKVATDRSPTGAEWNDLRFAWAVCVHVKSNAIVFTKDQHVVGVGAGQMSRVDSVRLAAAKAGDRAKGAVAASDAFFPFADGIEAAAAAGVTAVIQPGGSLRDAEVIAAANRLQIAMVTTGERHFRH